MAETGYFLGEGAFTGRDKTVEDIASAMPEIASANGFPEAVGKCVGELRRDASGKSEEYRQRTGSQILESGYTTGCTDTALAFLVIARQLGIPSKYVETLNTDWLNFRPSESLREKAAGFKKNFGELLSHLWNAWQGSNISKDEALKAAHEHWVDFSLDRLTTPDQLLWLLSPERIEGHVFVDINVGRWLACDPVKGYVDVRDIKGKEYYSLGRRDYTVVGRGLDFSEIYVFRRGKQMQNPENFQDISRAVEIAKNL